MNKTLRISASIKNTYRVNSILYALKQVPLLKRALPAALYRARGPKIFAGAVAAIWEVLSIFLGKFLYFLLMIAGAAGLYAAPDKGPLFLHIFLFLTVAGSFSNTYMFNPSRDKYYALILLRMDAREYTLLHYGYAMGKLWLGFAVFGLFFGLSAGLAVWQCALLPFSVAGLKMAVAAWSLREYERTGRAANENKLGKAPWLALFVLLVAAYGLPALGVLVPLPASLLLLAAFALAGAVSLRKLFRFAFYRDFCRQLLSRAMFQMDDVAKAVKQASEKTISLDGDTGSNRRGFEYLNELFVKRHRKILWKSARRTAAICLFLVLGALLLFYIQPGVRAAANELIMTFLPYSVFIMYAINRGTGFTQALFMNCDHSLLTYSFYKQPRAILALFRIRLREIIKVNLLPALVVGSGLAVLLYASGGTGNPVNYAVLCISIPCMSIFFSVHYLTIYYLLQPYTAGTELKSGTYRLILSATYFVCLLMMQLRLPTLLFGAMTIVFCIAYSAAACALVYRFAPRTFRLRT